MTESAPEVKTDKAPPAVATFETCLVDENAPLLTIEIKTQKGVETFNLRSVTALEYQAIFARAKIPNPRPSGPNGTFLTGDRLDTNGLAIFTVAYALGANGKIGGEGWSLEAKLTEENVARLDFAVVVHLYRRYQEFFRADRFGIEEPGSGDSLVVSKTDG